MRIAIIGAGFSGLATAWHLLHSHSTFPISVVVFDPKGIGGGASGMAAGLIHPYSGAHAKLNWQGIAGLQATHILLEASAKVLGRPVADPSGLLRVAITEAQQQDFSRCAQAYSDVAWQSPEECVGLAPGIVNKPGILIKSAIAVNCSLYLQGLWKACSLKGAVLEKQAVDSLSMLNEFDVIVVGMGIASKTLPELSSLPLTAVKGQILEIGWPVEVPPPLLPLNSQAYLIMNASKRSCFVGATFEKNFSTTGPVPEFALADLMPKAEALYPCIKNAPLIECRAGIRASTPDHHPIAKRINEKCWVIAGMGSKGLLYHALFAQKITQEILLNQKGP